MKKHYIQENGLLHKRFEIPRKQRGYFVSAPDLMKQNFYPATNPQKYRSCVHLYSSIFHDIYLAGEITYRYWRLSYDGCK